MQVFIDLKNNLLAQIRDPKQFLFLLFIILLMVDFILRGRLGYVGYISWHLQALLKGSDWQFIIILFLLLFRK